MAIGTALRRLRGEMTQQALAEGIGSTQPTVSRWEDPKKPEVPSFSEMQAIEDLLHLTRGAILVAAGLVAVTGVEAAVLADPVLDAQDAQFVLDVYKLRRDRAVHRGKSRK